MEIKIKIDVIEEGIDLMAFTAHKIYGPKGVGALYVRRRNPRVKLIAQMDGGGHERNMRSGTLNVPAIVGFSKACTLCTDDMQHEAKRISMLRDKLENSLLQIGGVSINGNKSHRMPHVTNLSFKDTIANTLMMRFKNKVAVSSGSACTSALPEPSYVLKAMGLNDALANASLRVALGRFTTEEDIDLAIQEIVKAVESARVENKLYNPL